MTGTEAISNGVSAFEKPEADNAGKTLIAMAVLLGIMFLGITYLARTVQVVPVEHESVVSQIGRAVFGSGPLYLALQAATALILVLAANTAFADFPRLVLHPGARWLCPPAISQLRGPPGLFQWHWGVSLPGGALGCALRRADA